ncbi:origin recognition complex subunit Orc6 [Schizosaccharomyces octosporus yFS286]|uniref:Origin recognition complex subunit Orc6 n=1 Tax=Schizosaccharomyces octosporus (strain yFS286) TaxID=483514 RepID=S9PTP3_SCHOY|nr:origin recognition complex subunit Orc6 [Schizosaccharomyces octosporus yFS286]EPX72501.1 origin recognition complex subunit Orc6 [Schizosaccharomyces octosporus yFS286]
MERQQVIDSFRKLLPEEEEYNDRLLSLAESFLAWSRSKVVLKATEEPCRPYMAAHLACEVMKGRLDLEVHVTATPIPKKKYEKQFTYFQEELRPLTKDLYAQHDIMNDVPFLCTRMGSLSAIPYVKELVKTTLVENMRIEHMKGVLIAAYLIVSAKMSGKDELRVNHAERKAAQVILQDTNSISQIQYWMQLLSESLVFHQMPLNAMEGYEVQKQRTKPWSGIASMVQINYEKRLKSYPSWKASIYEQLEQLSQPSIEK